MEYIYITDDNNLMTLDDFWQYILYKIGNEKMNGQSVAAIKASLLSKDYFGDGIIDDALWKIIVDKINKQIA